MFQEWFKEISMKLKGCFKCFNHILYFLNEDSRYLQENFKGVLNFFKECFPCISCVLEGCLKSQVLRCAKMFDRFFRKGVSMVLL